VFGAFFCSRDITSHCVVLGYVYVIYQRAGDTSRFYVSVIIVYDQWNSSVYGFCPFHIFFQLLFTSPMCFEQVAFQMHSFWNRTSVVRNN
jgi:hypothetical protein